MAFPAPATKAAILSALQARPALANVQKRYSPPTEEEAVTWAMVWLGDTTIPDDNWSQLGAQRRRATFHVEFTVAAIEAGDNAQSAEATAWAIYDEVIAALRADPTLGGTVQQFDAVPAKCETGVSGQQWTALVTGRVVCTSRAY